MHNRRRVLIPLMALVGVFVPVAGLRAQHVGLTVARTTSDIITTYGNGTAGSHQNRDAVAAGLTYRHSLRRRTVLQAELLWLPKGYGPASKPTRTLGYVEVPVLLRIGALAPTGAALSPVLSLGPTVAVLATCRLQGLQAISASERCDQVLTTPFAQDYRMRRIDAGLMLGLGLEGRARDGSIFGVEGRYELGLLDSERQAGTSRNSTFFVMLHVVPSRLY